MTKFFTEVSKYSKRTLKYQKLYGWGLNGLGQLGLPNVNTVHQPTKIILPFLDEDQEIIRVLSGGKSSCILTSNNKIWLTRNVQKKNSFNEIEEKIKKEESKKQDNKKQDNKKQDNKKQDNKKNDKKKNKKNEEKHSKEIFDKSQENLRWIEISSAFTILK